MPWSESISIKMEWGMRPSKMWVRSAVILDGRVAHSILIELLSDAGIGTMLTN